MFDDGLSEELPELDLVEADLPPRHGDCAYCGSPAEGEYSIHRDGFGEGPEVPLCNACGSANGPTCEGIWNRTAQP